MLIQKSTQIFYLKEKGCLNGPEFVGYCKESPLYVLLKLYRDYRIFRYKGIVTPTDNRFDKKGSGLIIIESEAPTGTTITGSIDDLDLNFAKEQEPRTEELCYDSLRDAIESYLIRHDNYLKTRETNQKKMQEKRLNELLEVAFVTLKISNPTSKDLEFIASD